MKVLLIVLSMAPNGKYKSLTEFMAQKNYTAESACKAYGAHDCEIRKGKLTYCMGPGTEGACDPWELWGVKPK